jgi:hypothetical protein
MLSPGHQGGKGQDKGFNMRHCRSPGDYKHVFMNLCKCPHSLGT